MHAGKWLFPKVATLGFFSAYNGAHKLSAIHREAHKHPGILKNGEKRNT